MIRFGESGHPVFRATNVLSRGALKSKGGKLSIHFCANGRTIETVFRTLFLLVSSVSMEQSQSCVEEYKSCHVRTERLKTPTRSTDDPSQEDLLQKYQERVERLSQQNRVIKICIDAGFHPDNSWSRTVLHDRGHWRILTIYRVSGLSRVHLAKRRRHIWTEGLDQREHQNQARIGSYNLLPTRLIWSGNEN